MTFQDVYRYSLRRLVGTHGEYRVHERWATVPNLVTGLGIMGVALYVWLFTTNSAVWAIPVVHLAILASDGIDGILADRLDQHSWVGKALDPVRDRTHAAALFANLILVSGHVFVTTALLVAVAAEIWIGLLGLRGAIQSVHFIGKARAGIYGICGTIALIQIYWTEREFIPLMLLAGLMMLASIAAACSYSMRRNRP